MIKINTNSDVPLSVNDILKTYKELLKINAPGIIQKVFQIFRSKMLLMTMLFLKTTTVFPSAVHIVAVSYSLKIAKVTLYI